MKTEIYFWETTVKINILTEASKLHGHVLQHLKIQLINLLNKKLRAFRDCALNNRENIYTTVNMDLKKFSKQKGEFYDLTSLEIYLKY